MKLKNLLLGLLLTTGAVAAQAQTFYICNESNTETTRQLTFANGGMTVNGVATADIDSITTHVPDLRFVGGDISLLPSYEENGAQYKDRDGQAISGPLLNYLKEQGWNAMRVRLFVDPSQATATEKGEGVRQDLSYVIALGKQIKEAGLLLMLDFHYSDSWADPAKQWTPASWLNLSNDQLYTRIYDYTLDCLNQMNAAGASPDFIQTGNEISYGMLWGSKGATANRCYSGSEDNWPRFTTLLKQAVKACREACPQAKVVIHTERVKQVSVLNNFYSQMAKYGVDYDIIGLSYYPYYHGNLTTLNTALNRMEGNFPDKRIMIVETGHSYNYKVGDDDTGYALTPAGQKQFTLDLIDLLKRHPNVDGLFWWFPEANEFGLNWATHRVTDKWYNAGLFDNNTGRALDALYELKNFR